MIASRNLFWIIPLVVAVSGPLWWDFAADLLAPPKTVHRQGGVQERNFVMEGVSLVQTRDGKEEFRLKAKRVTSKKNQTVLHLEDVNAVLGEEQAASIRSKEAVLNTNQGIVTLLDDVQFDMNGNYQARTPVARYFTKFKKIKSAAPIELWGERMKLSGTSFFYDLVSGDFRVGKRVFCRLW